MNTPRCPRSDAPRRLSRLGHSTLVGAALASVAMMSSCAEQDVSMSVEFALPVNNVTCTPPQTSGTTTSTLTRGTADLAMARSYVVYPVVFNNMPDLRDAKGFTDPTTGRTNTSKINLSRVEVRFLPQERLSVNLPSKVELPLSGSIPTEGSTTVGVEVLSESLLRSIRNSEEFLGVGAQGEAVPLRNSLEMVVGLTVHGQTLAGKHLESNEFLFPIELCNGCLVTVPNGAVDPDQQTPNCLLYDPFSFDEDSVNCPNLLGQDFAVDCRVCKSQPATPLSAQLCEPSAGL